MEGKQFPVLSDEISVEGKVVLVRSALNVPVKNSKVQNAFRIERALETLLYLSRRGARVVVIAHIGRKPEETLLPVFESLKDKLPITFVDQVFGEKVVAEVEKLQQGSVLLLENVRSHPGETANDDMFAKELASLADIYVNDAFPASHRRHASIVGVPKHLESYAGLAFNEEYTKLKESFTPEHPSLFIVGGAKFETKEALLSEYLTTYSKVFVGGALANDFLKAKGYEVGQSLVSGHAERIEALLGANSLVLPIDVVTHDGNERKVVSVNEVQPNEKILDVGPRTIEMLSGIIAEAKTILWNGPLGYYEGGFVEQTESCARHIAESNAKSIVGGGDTIAAIERLNLSKEFDFVSAAGGAMLTFLETKTLPGIDAISK